MMPQPNQPSTRCTRPDDELDGALAAAGMTAVAIVKKTAYGMHAYHAHCLTCGWRCWQDKGHDGAHQTESVALKHGRAHRCAE